MKNIIFKFFLLILTLIIILLVYLSTLGIETERFNKEIKNRIIKIDKNLDLDLKKIKLILDPFKFKIYVKTVGSTVYYLKRPLSLEYIKSEISLKSITKNKIISSNIEVATRSILLKDFIKFVRAKNNEPQLFLLEKIVKDGHIILNLSFNIDDNGKIKDDYKIKGLIKNTSIKFLNQSEFKNINLNFNIKQNNYNLKDIVFETEKVIFISEKINIKKRKNNFSVNGILKNDNSNFHANIFKLVNLNFGSLDTEGTKFTSNNKFSVEVDNKFNFENFILSTDLNINQFKYKKPKIIDDYFIDIKDKVLLKNHKINLNYKNGILSAKGEGEILLENEIDKIKYTVIKKQKDLNINADLFSKNINLKRQDFLKTFFSEINEKINFNNQEINIKYNKNNLSISGKGKLKIKDDFEQIDYLFEKKENEIKFDTKLNLKNTNFKIDNINYKKKEKTNMLLQIKGELIDGKNLNINNFIINEENNKIKIMNLFLNRSYKIKKIDQAELNYIDTENKKNKLIVKKISDFDYIINGNYFNANFLISNLLKNEEKKEINFFENDINIELDLKEVYIDEIYSVKDLSGKFKIENNKVSGADILAIFDDSQNIKFTIRTNEHGEKITTLFSSKAKPLVNRYKFIKGFEDGRDGYLDFYSLKKNGISTSKLVIDNFKVKEIPALAKLLALASLQGLADLLTGEGIRFTDFEMNFTNENKLMRIQELYAIGPAISILLEGYKEGNNLISFRGTLVPATTINRTIASIPLLGNLLIGKKAGEGVFGVSFKIKGPPNDLETTVNPIKTLTPRFITRTLEKIKKN